MRRRIFIFLLAVGLVWVAVIPAALAGKKGGNGPQEVEASISLNTQATARSVVSLGSTVDFITTYGKKIKDPRVAVRCYQEDTLVYAMAGPVDYQFLLGGAMSDWLMSGGDADCTAELFWLSSKGNGPQEYTSLAWTSFWAAG